MDPPMIYPTDGIGVHVSCILVQHAPVLAVPDIDLDQFALVCR